ncbi:MAG: AAA family ATPase [Candidatus Eremiobacteraeota bacterium]|nr:AAA family ATPase [Candidatus Eremiobacteraeota bacterium]
MVIDRVRLTNYKSIAKADVRLGPLTLLVGLNGSGKSNFLDAMRFVSDALNAPLDYAFRERGGLNDVRRRSDGHPTHFGIRLDFTLPSGTRGTYSFKIGSRKEGNYSVDTEECILHPQSFPALQVRYKTLSGKVQFLENAPPVARDRLYLVNVSGLTHFEEAFNTLKNLRFYNLNPEAIRDFQPASTDPYLLRDGANITTVLRRIENDDPKSHALIVQYLSAIVPQIQDVSVATIGKGSLGKLETLAFKQQVSARKALWPFAANSMSDGTLRAVGILVALFQDDESSHNELAAIGIEEPEVAVHPGALNTIFSAILRASERRQIIVTSHSPDLLDDDRITADMIRAVSVEKGATYITTIDEGAKQELARGLHSAGDLLRLNQLVPDRDDVERQQRLQISLFGDR